MIEKMILSNLKKLSKFCFLFLCGSLVVCDSVVICFARPLQEPGFLVSCNRADSEGSYFTAYRNIEDKYQEIHIEGNNEDGYSVALFGLHLSSFEQIPVLLREIISGNRYELIDNNGQRAEIVSFESMPDFSNIAILDLRDNSFLTVKGVSNFTRLYDLDLSGNYSLSDFDELERMTQLDNLNLDEEQYNPNVTEAVISDLQAKLPDCNIELGFEPTGFPVYESDSESESDY